MCDKNCTEQLQKALADAIAQRNEAYKIYRQWEGAVSMLNRLIPMMTPQAPVNEDS